MSWSPRLQLLGADRGHCFPLPSPHDVTLAMVGVYAPRKLENCNTGSPFPPAPPQACGYILTSTLTAGWGWARVWGLVIFPKRSYMTSMDATTPYPVRGPGQCECWAAGPGVHKCPREAQKPVFYLHRDANEWSYSPGHLALFGNLLS